MEAINDEGAEPYGIELQDQAAAIAAAKFPGRVAVGDVCTIELRLPPADLVTMTDLIEHVADPETVLIQRRY